MGVAGATDGAGRPLATRQPATSSNQKNFNVNPAGARTRARLIIRRLINSRADDKQSARFRRFDLLPPAVRILSDDGGGGGLSLVALGDRSGRPRAYATSAWSALAPLQSGAVAQGLGERVKVSLPQGRGRNKASRRRRQPHRRRQRRPPPPPSRRPGGLAAERAASALEQATGNNR